jgi:hypothetical protein
VSIDSRRELSQFAESIVDAFLLQVGERGGSGDALRVVARDFVESPHFATLVDQFMHNLAQLVAHRLMQERRADPFRRLACHPLTELLDQGTLSRGLLDNYFTFLHLVLGDDQTVMTAHCQEIVDEIKDDPHFSWDMFYDDPRAKLLLWQMLMRILDTFKRFEPRRDWLISLMQNRSHATSLASNAFVTRPRGEDEPPFGLAEFTLLMAALYGPLLQLSGTDEAAFAQAFGAPPAKWVRPLLAQLS